MNIFKKLFKREKKEEKPQTECWYNSAHEQPMDKWDLPTDPGSLSSPNSGLYSTAMQAARNQNR